MRNKTKIVGGSKGIAMERSQLKSRLLLTILGIHQHTIRSLMQIKVVKSGGKGQWKQRETQQLSKGDEIQRLIATNSGSTEGWEAAGCAERGKKETGWKITNGTGGATPSKASISPWKKQKGMTG